jgi:formylglycine-generating enzyme required for sulfatase activity
MPAALGRLDLFTLGKPLRQIWLTIDGNYTYGQGPKGTSIGSKPQTLVSFRPIRFGLYDMHGNV